MVLKTRNKFFEDSHEYRKEKLVGKKARNLFWRFSRISGAKNGGKKTSENNSLLNHSWHTAKSSFMNSHKFGIFWNHYGWNLVCYMSHNWCYEERTGFFNNWLFSKTNAFQCLLHTQTLVITCHITNTYYILSQLFTH